MSWVKSIIENISHALIFQLFFYVSDFDITASVFMWPFGYLVYEIIISYLWYDVINLAKLAKSCVLVKLKTHLYSGKAPVLKFLCYHYHITYHAGHGCNYHFD